MTDELRVPEPRSAKHLLLGQEYLAFLLLNVCDLFLTGYIFRHNGHEANALAAWVLDQFGLKGFAIYKFILLTIVILACEGISTKHPRKARQVIYIACIVFLAVVFWECWLIAGPITAAG